MQLRSGSQKATLKFYSLPKFLCKGFRTGLLERDFSKYACTEFPYKTFLGLLPTLGCVALCFLFSRQFVEVGGFELFSRMPRTWWGDEGPSKPAGSVDLAPWCSQQQCSHVKIPNGPKWWRLLRGCGPLSIWSFAESGQPCSWGISLHTLQATMKAGTHTNMCPNRALDSKSLAPWMKAPTT